MSYFFIQQIVLPFFSYSNLPTLFLLKKYIINISKQIDSYNTDFFQYIALKLLYNNHSYIIIGNNRLTIFLLNS